ncbi:MAG: metalloregulator ArsR/SmtB family transcription factor [Acidobacteriota bacterium]
MPADLLAVVASPRRREILRLLWDGERTAGELHEAMPDITFGAVSLQLKVLREAGVVERRADGQARVYRVRHEALGDLAPMLEQMWGDALWRLKLRAELDETRRGPRPGRGRTRRSHGGRRRQRRKPS